MEVLELLCCLLEFLDAASILTAFFAWLKSEPYRDARKIAKSQGEETSANDFWFQVFVFLTPIAITLTILVIWKWVG